jgi:hypothetical protein
MNCRLAKKGCNYERLCARCAKAGLGFNDCNTEGEGSRANGSFGGNPLKADGGDEVRT